MRVQRELRLGEAGGAAVAPAASASEFVRADLDAEYAFIKGLIEAGGEWAPDARAAGAFALEAVQATAGTTDAATALVTLRGPAGPRTDTGSGSGPIEALYHAIDRITGSVGSLVSYSARSVARGKGAVVGVFIRVEFDGRSYASAAAGTDIIFASAQAYLGAVNMSHSADATRIEGLELEALTGHAAEPDPVADWI